MSSWLPRERVRQRLLRYFEAKDDLEIRCLDPKTIQIRTLGWSPYPWIDIKIEMFQEKNNTRLTIDFSFRRVSALIIAVAAMVTVFCWFISWNLLDAIIITIVIGVGASISYASERSKIRRKYLKDIQTAFNQSNTTEQHD